MELADGFQSKGFHTINFNASSLSTGIYFYSMTYEANGMNANLTKKMALIK